MKLVMKILIMLKAKENITIKRLTADPTLLTADQTELFTSEMMRARILEANDRIIIIARILSILLSQTRTTHTIPLKEIQN